jgi:hypothetical protein
MKRLPTDLKIPETISVESFDIYAAYEKDPTIRQEWNFVEVDITKVAAKLGTDANMVFARLYYHLEHKHGYEQADGNSVHFLARVLGPADRPPKHFVNFPYMTAILADLQHEHWVMRLTIGAAAVSTLAAVASAVAAVWWHQ